MRIVFIGAGKISVGAAKALIQKNHEVVIIDCDKSRIEELSEEMDCSFLHGDGSTPDILREANPSQTDILFCLTDNDQINVIASLVGRSLGFKRVITSISNPQFEGICLELGLGETIIPARTISRYLEDMVRGEEKLELSTIMKDTARFFTFIAGQDDALSVRELKLPTGAKVICYYRDGKFSLADENSRLRKDDETVILTDSNTVPKLQERWKPKQGGQTE